MQQTSPLLDMGKRPLVTWVLLAANIVVWIALELAGGSESGEVLQDFGALFGPLIASGEYWRLFTAMFLHVGLFHFLFNGFALLIFGRMVEAIYGGATFTVIYVLAGLSGSVASYMMNPLSIGAGASGAIFGVLGALGAFFFTRRNVLGEMGRQNFMGIAMLAAINLLFGFARPGIDNWAHMGGLVMGFAIGMAYAPQARIVVLPLRTYRRLDNAHTLVRRWWVLPVAAAVLFAGIWWANSNMTDPTLSLTHVYEAERQLQMRSYAMALTEVNLAIRLDSINGRAYFLRGKIFADLGEKARASGDLLKAVFLAGQSGDRDTLDRAREELRALGLFQ